MLTPPLSSRPLPDHLAPLCLKSLLISFDLFAVWGNRRGFSKGLILFHLQTIYKPFTTHLQPFTTIHMNTDTPLKPYLQRVQDLRAKGLSLRKMVAVLEEENAQLPPHSAKWNHTTVGQLFQQLDALARG